MMQVMVMIVWSLAWVWWYLFVCAAGLLHCLHSAHNAVSLAHCCCIKLQLVSSPSPPYVCSWKHIVLVVYSTLMLLVHNRIRTNKRSSVTAKTRKARQIKKFALCPSSSPSRRSSASSNLRDLGIGYLSSSSKWAQRWCRRSSDARRRRPSGAADDTERRSRRHAPRAKQNSSCSSNHHHLLLLPARTQP